MAVPDAFTGPVDNVEEPEVAEPEESDNSDAGYLTMYAHPTSPYFIYG